MAPLLALAVGYVLAKMFDVFKHGENGAPIAPGPAAPPPPARRRPAASARRPAPATPSPPPSTRPASLPAATTVPWPQVAPTGLPPFPGSGWEPDEPPPPVVVSRAMQLLSQLWKGGEGTFKPEQTAGRWIIYRATNMGGKKGVVAFRESRHAAFLTPPPSSDDSDTPTAPASAPAPASGAPPTIRRGSKGDAVRVVQRKLGLEPVDGDFGPATESAVRNYQGHHALTPDGIVGPKTWAAMGVQSLTTA